MNGFSVHISNHEKRKMAKRLCKFGELFCVYSTDTFQTIFNVDSVQFICGCLVFCSLMLWSAYTGEVSKLCVNAVVFRNFVECRHWAALGSEAKRGPKKEIDSYNKYVWWFDRWTAFIVDLFRVFLPSCWESAHEREKSSCSGQM